MANEITVTAGDVRPLTGAITRRLKAGGTLALGDAVYLDSNGELQKCAGGAVASSVCVGVVVSAPEGGTTIAAGDYVDVVVLGPVTGFSSMTPGTHVWVSDTAGRLSSVVGTKSGVIGIAESATTVLVRPWTGVVSA